MKLIKGDKEMTRHLELLDRPALISYFALFAHSEELQGKIIEMIPN